jgi:hypothetical protein
LRAKYLQHLLALGREWERAGRWEEAAGLYLRGVEADELVEAFYQQRPSLPGLQHAESMVLRLSQSVTDPLPDRL